MPTTNGLKTTEFWLSVLTIVAGTVALLTGNIDADKWIFVITGAAGAYNLSRGLAKIGPSAPSASVNIATETPQH